MSKPTVEKITEPLPANPANKPSAPNNGSQSATAKREHSQAKPTGDPGLKASSITTTPKPAPIPAPPAAKPPALASAQPATTKSQIAPAPQLAKPKTVNVKFVLVKPEAKKVSLCGEFNGWSPEAMPMKGIGGGHWEATLALRPGKYQYKFVVDGEWLVDPAALENVPNVHGSLNSVRDVHL
jgi:hypothetical protein